VDQNAITTTGNVTLASVPDGVRTLWQGNIYVSANIAAANRSNVSVRPVGTTGAGTATEMVSAVNQISAGAPITPTAATTAQVLTNTSQQVAVTYNSTSGGSYSLVTRGWIDRRGRDA
jgi:hypothetical protein